MATGAYPPPRLFSVAFITPKGDPIFVKAFSVSKTPSRLPDDLLKANYVGNCSLDVFEERERMNPKATECYLGMLFNMDGLSVYGYITPTNVKIVVAFTQSELLVKDSDAIMIFKALYLAYYRAISNPFLKLGLSDTAIEDTAQLLQSNTNKWKQLEREVIKVVEATGPAPPKPNRPV